MVRRAIMVVVAATAIAAPAAAQFEQLAPGDYRCSAPAGDYYNHAIPALEPGKPVTFRIKLIKENKDPTWLEQGGLYFETPQGKMRVQVGKADNDQQHFYVAAFRADTNDWQIIDQYPVTNDWIALTVMLGDNGVLQVTSRGNTGALDFQTTLPVKTELHCHSGVFEMQVSPAPVVNTREKG